MRPGANGTVTSCPASLAAFSTAAHPPSTIRSASETFFPPDWPSLKSCWICSRTGSTSASSAGSLTSQSFCGSRRIRAPLAPPRLSVPRKLAADAHAVETSCATDRPESSSARLERGDVRVVDQLVVDGRNRVLPQLRLGDPRAEVARDRAHVAVQQLVPRLGERLGELLGVVEPAPGDRPVDRVEPQREVSGEHHRRAPLRRVVRVGHGALGLGVGRHPLPGAGRALGQLPLVAVQVLQEAVVPLVGVAGPGTLEAAGDRVAALAGAVAALPAQALLLERRALGLGADVVGGRRRRGSCRRCGRRRSARRSPRRSSPSGRTSRGCRGRRPAGPACRWAPPG